MELGGALFTVAVGRIKGDRPPNPAKEHIANMEQIGYITFIAELPLNRLSP